LSAREKNKDEETQLLARIEEQKNKPNNQLSVATRLNYSIDLGVLYLKDPERWNDAGQFFKQLTALPNPRFKALGKLGTASMLAFRDQPEESNKLFLEVLGS